MNYILLFFATLASAAKVIMCKKIGHDSKNKQRMFLYNGVIFIVASLVILASMLTDIKAVFEISPFSFVLALLFAFFILFTQTGEILAMNYGSVSMTMMIFSCGFLIPIFYGCIFLNESISPWQIIGLAVLIVALVMIISPKKNERLSWLWLVFTVLSTLGSGTNAVIQKIHQASEHKGELLPFLFFALLFSSIFSFVASLLTRGGENTTKESKNRHSEALLFLLLGGVCVGVLNILNLALAGKLPAVVQFPVYSIGSMILSGLAARFIYRERMSRRKLIGFGIGCVAITVIAVF